MFDLITGRPSHATVPFLISAATEMMTVSAILGISVMWVSDVPSVRSKIGAMMATVAELPPPPPPPPAGPVARAEPPGSSADVPAVEPIRTSDPVRMEWRSPEEEAVPGGVVGGVPGGVVSGQTLPVAAPEPLALDPRPQPTPEPVRITGTLQAPRLVRRVAPKFPAVAVQARASGVVVVEAVVDAAGHVTKATVVSSSSRLFDAAALEAVQEWQYEPLLLTGQPTPFVLTVTLTFAQPRSS